MTALLVSVLAGCGAFVRQYAIAWTPLQRLYFSSYVRTAVIANIGVSGTGRYRVLYVTVDRTHRLAVDDDLRHGRALVWNTQSYPHSAFHAFLRRGIYNGRGLAALAQPTIWPVAGLALLGLLVAVPADMLRARRRRHGRRLKGPELVSVRRFTDRLRATGVGFVQRSGTWLRVPRALESSHFLIVGDSGTGKSVLIRQLLQQLEARGETAIVYDPALEYTGQFYTPARGDVVLNPLDRRCPFWTPGDEWRHEAETLTLATSLFPDRHHDNTFFTEAPRRIFAHLLTLRPRPDELAWWLCHEEEIDRRLAGTAYAAMIDRQAPAQRSGVLASLNMVADTLKLLPREAETTRRWSASAWAQEWPHGWLFLTSTPETRPRLVPLTSLWLDTLVLRLMNQGQPRPRPTWFVLDELASLQRLPQLHTAITENRKSNNPVVLGFQGRSQLETRYGHDAEAMLSQPATKIFLRTSEPHAAKWIAETIGDVEIERLRESRSHGGPGRQSFGLERQVEPLVMASEISGLPALCGYVKVGNLVSRLQVAFVARSTQAPAYVERPQAGSNARFDDSPNSPGGNAPSPVATPGHVLMFG
jgi:type IV secretory pathway TraG/TraD family ATPase VirD4